jgi:sn-glycerol 3-phosphate transport system permease protein
MIEKRPVSNLIGHMILIVGIIIVAFPIYYTFVASTMTSTQIIRPPISLLPGDHFVENYGEAIFGGVERVVGVSLERLLWNSFVVAMALLSARSSSPSCLPSRLCSSVSRCVCSSSG